MKLVGKAKIKELKTQKTPNGKLIAKGQIYFSNKVGEKDGKPVIESDFIQSTFVGKALEKVLLQAKLKGISKLPIYVSESSFRNKSYKGQDGLWKNFTEVVVFDIEDVHEHTQVEFTSSPNISDDLPF